MSFTCGASSGLGGPSAVSVTSGATLQAGASVWEHTREGSKGTTFMDHLLYPKP